MIENPDGTLVEGLPPGYKEKTPPRSTRIGFSAEGLLWGELEPQNLTEEISFLFHRHESLFIALLAIQFLFESIALCLYIATRESTVQELTIQYGEQREKAIRTIFFSGFFIYLAFFIIYYFIAYLCITRSRKSFYKQFAIVSCFGIGLEVSLTYVNKFNLVIFFLRLLTYIYSKFIRGMISNMNIVSSLNAELPPEFFTDNNNSS